MPHVMAAHYGNMPTAGFRSSTPRFASGVEAQMQDVRQIENPALAKERPGPGVGSYYYASKRDERGNTTLARRTLSLWGLPADDRM